MQSGRRYPNSDGPPRLLRGAHSRKVHPGLGHYDFGAVGEVSGGCKAQTPGAGIAR